jgi:hypothetical protein
MVLVFSSVAAAGTVKLPRTGQTTTYTPGDDGDLQKGETWPQWPDSRFIDHGDGTITDTFTGLMWTKAAVKNGNWQAALDYVKGMNAGTNQNYGFTDWRFPNINELESLIDYSMSTPPALPSHHPFNWSSTCSYYWTSTTAPGTTNSAYFMLLGSGNFSQYSKGADHIYMSFGCDYYFTLVPVRTLPTP